MKQEYKIEENLNKDVLLYQLCYLTEKIKPTPISLIISNVKVFLTSEYHQWPLPRLQPPLPLHLRGQHFQVITAFQDYAIICTTFIRACKIIFIPDQEIAILNDPS